MSNPLFTIGHSTHSPTEFISLLKRHQISVVCDVRSKPYSRFNPQFNREAIKKALRDSEIKYGFMGRELGARTDDQTCYEQGRVRYERLARTRLFREGLTRIQEGMTNYRIALMCAEKEPLDCHRTILVARFLAEQGISIEHILADGQLEKHEVALGRLIKLMDSNEQHHMFRSREELVADAYLWQEERIAYQVAATEDASEKARDGVAT